MRYLLDTNFWIVYLKGKSETVRKRLEATAPDDIAVCSVVWAELLHGARKYEKRQEREKRIELLLSPFECLQFDLDSARRYAIIRDDLERNGCVIGGNDLMIASIAFNHGLTLVTNNLDEFRRIPTLSVEDWS